MDIKKYKWKNRLLIIRTPNKNNNKYKDIINIYNKNKKEFNKKFILLKTFIDNIKETKIYLIGFDNKVKHTYNKLNPDIIFNHIAKMPMGSIY